MTHQPRRRQRSSPRPSRRPGAAAARDTSLSRDPARLDPTLADSRLAAPDDWPLDPGRPLLLRLLALLGAFAFVMLGLGSWVQLLRSPALSPPRLPLPAARNRAHA